MFKILGLFFGGLMLAFGGLSLLGQLPQILRERDPAVLAGHLTFYALWLGSGAILVKAGLARKTVIESEERSRSIAAK